MGLMVIMDPADYFARGAGMPPDAQRALGSRGKLHHGWRSKTPTERMRDFHKKLLWASRAGSWTTSGMAVEHLRHYLANSGQDYAPNMPKLLDNEIIREEFDEMTKLGLRFVESASLRPGESFHSREMRQITPRKGVEHGAVAQTRHRDAWYSVGTFSAWIDGTVAPNHVRIRLHVLDFYDWDQTHFSVPIPDSLCKRLDNPIVKMTVGKAIDDMQEHGTIKRDGCQVTADDTIMNELHLMGLAKNYVTRGVHEEQHPLSTR